VRVGQRRQRRPAGQGPVSDAGPVSRANSCTDFDGRRRQNSVEGTLFPKEACMSQINPRDPLRQGAEIQKMYVDTRTKAINKRDQDRMDAVSEVILAMQRRHERPNLKISETYNRINAALQGSDLTINLEAANWFLQPCPFQTYATMYQKGINPNSGKMVL